MVDSFFLQYLFDLPWIFHGKKNICADTSNIMGLDKLFQVPHVRLTQGNFASYP